MGCFIKHGVSNLGEAVAKSTVATVKKAAVFTGGGIAVLVVLFIGVAAAVLRCRREIKRMVSRR